MAFQSHAGSIEAAYANAHTGAGFLWFQSHAGSIEAESQSSLAHCIPVVSIPRWFD